MDQYLDQFDNITTKLNTTGQFQDNLVLAMKNMHELERELSPRNSEFRFLNRAVPLFMLENFSLKPGYKRFVKCIAPFPANLTGTAIVKIVQGLRTITIQCKLQNNLGVLDMVNASKTNYFPLIQLLTLLISDQWAFSTLDMLPCSTISQISFPS